MPDYSLAELVALSGIGSRTIRYYIAEGLIPSPGREGPATRYPETTLAKLRLIARLRDAHQPLSEIRAQLEALTEDELLELANAPAQSAPSDSALDYIRAVLGEPRAELREEPPAFRPIPVIRAAAMPSPAVPASPAAATAPASPLSAMAAPTAAPPPNEPSTPTLAGTERSQWERIALAHGIELHVRRPLSRRENRMVERLIAFARQLQGEEQL